MTDDRVVYDFGPFRVDPQRRRLLLRIEGSALALPPRVFDTLLALIEHRDELLSKSTLMSLIWPHTIVEENSLNRNISLLRRILGEKPGDHSFIVTARGQGYRFVSDVTVPKVVDGTSSDVENREEPGDRDDPVGTRTNSVAVLPFANLTGDASKDYICFGIVEELIHRLTSVAGLKVPARTSSFAYKERGADVRLIARKLGVRFVLEGGVRAAGDTLRIGAQLIDGVTGYHVWSQSFDRSTSDLLVL